jgi:hypothetical protein
MEATPDSLRNVTTDACFVHEGTLGPVDRSQQRSEEPCRRTRTTAMNRPSRRRSARQRCVALKLCAPLRVVASRKPGAKEPHASRNVGPAVAASMATA